MLFSRNKKDFIKIFVVFLFCFFSLALIVSFRLDFNFAKETFSEVKKGFLVYKIVDNYSILLLFAFVLFNLHVIFFCWQLLLLFTKNYQQELQVIKFFKLEYKRAVYFILAAGFSYLIVAIVSSWLLLLIINTYVPTVFLSINSSRVNLLLLLFLLGTANYLISGFSYYKRLNLS